MATVGRLIGSLRLKDGNVVADVGCGVGQFSMKLAPKVAEHGSVLAEDILGEPLTFLWIRAFLHHQSNIRVIHGDPDGPRLPKGAVDAVLIANTYHEFTNPLAVLDHSFRALRSDGRLVVLDRALDQGKGKTRGKQLKAAHHAVQGAASLARHPLSCVLPLSADHMAFLRS